jgi:Domain of unknown function (DUF4332)
MPEKKHNAFKLKDFLGVNPEHIARLEAIGVKNTAQMLIAGRTAAKREELAKKANVPLEAVVELVKLSDLARLPGVKGIRARLYYAAGVDTVEKMAAWEPEALLAMTTEFVKATGFAGIAPLPKEVSSTINNAKKLAQVVEW